MQQAIDILDEMMKEAKYISDKMLLREAKSRIQALGDGWIAVSERFPELTEEGGSPTVITYDSRGYIGENCYFYNNDLWEGEWSNDDEYVTHWRAQFLPPTI